MKELQAQVKEFLPKNDNPDEQILKPKYSYKTSILPKFYFTSKEQSQNIFDMQRLLSWKENPSDLRSDVDPEKLDILNIFGPNANMTNLVQENGKIRMLLSLNIFIDIMISENALMEKGQYTKLLQLSLFKGDISFTIREAIREKRVTPFIISLAPMVSPKFVIV